LTQSGRHAEDGSVHAFRVLIVCTANLCRSPMAEALLDRQMRQAGLGWSVSSAGIRARNGRQMHEFAASTLTSRGLQTTGWRSRRLDAGIAGESDLILTATAAHRGAVVTLEPRAVARTFPLLQFARLVAASEVTAADLAGLGPTESGQQLIKLATAARTDLQPVESGGYDIADPIGKPLAYFESCAAILSRAIEQIVRSPSGPSRV
jgi:protein-tyrosine phosphatase